MGNLSTTGNYTRALSRGGKSTCTETSEYCRLPGPILYAPSSFVGRNKRSALRRMGADGTGIVGQVGPVNSSGVSGHGISSKGRKVCAIASGYAALTRPTNTKSDRWCRAQ